MAAMTYAVGGKRYVAVSVGWGNASANFMPAFAPETASIPRGAVLMVFALPD
jgi:hypothetical protein